MTLYKLLLPALATLAFASTVPTGAVAQQRGTQAYRPSNAQARVDMRSRIAAAIDRVRVTEQHGKLTPTRSAELQRQLVQAQREMASLSRRQGFVSAAELAGYDRLIVGIDAEMGDNAGVRSYGNDALPSAEVTAFQRADARLHYRNARIEYDAQGCAGYQGTTSNGRVRREPLRGPNGRPICARR